MNCRHATHPCTACFWVPEQEPPGDISLAARRHMAATQILGFWLNCLAMMNTRQATRVDLTRCWSFGVFGVILIGEKGSFK